MSVNVSYCAVVLSWWLWYCISAATAVLPSGICLHKI